MSYETNTVASKDEQITILFNGKTYTPFDDLSVITIEYHLDDSDGSDEIDDPAYLLENIRVFGTVSLSEYNPTFSIKIEFDTDNGGWKIGATRIEKVMGEIFPHTVEINCDTQEILIRFDIYS